MLGLDGIHRASSSRIGPRASARSSRLTTIGLSRRFLAGSNAAADNYRIGHARSLFTAGFLGRGFDSRRLHQRNSILPQFFTHETAISTERGEVFGTNTESLRSNRLFARHPEFIFL